MKIILYLLFETGPMITHEKKKMNAKGLHKKRYQNRHVLFNRVTFSMNHNRADPKQMHDENFSNETPNRNERRKKRIAKHFIIAFRTYFSVK